MNNYPKSNYSYNQKDGKSLSQQIIEKIDIVDVIGRYINLTKMGKDYKGLCPFHDDKNPSLSVTTDKKCYKCFSCGESGNVIKFVSKFKKITYTQAMRELAKEVGIEFKLTKAEIEHDKNEKYYRLMEDACNFYQFYLNQTENGEEALQYLHNRGLNDDVIKQFKIGVCGENDELVKQLSNMKDPKNPEKPLYIPLDMLKINLVMQSSVGYHDFFKNRIVFPLENLNGEIVGFSGRKYRPKDLKDDTIPKYKNSQDSIIFKKGDILYNYFAAIDSIKEKGCVYLFEGFMDAIAAVRAGVENSVASMGTALTINQIKAIKRYTNNIVVGFDSDGPGVDATLNAINLLIMQDFNIKVICYPDGKDADEYIFNHGKEALYDQLTNHLIPGIDFIYRYYYGYVNVNDISTVEIFKNKIYEALQNFNKLAITEAYLNKLSKDTHIPIDALREDFTEYKKTHQPTIPVLENNTSNNNYTNSNYNDYNNYNNDFGFIPPQDDIPNEIFMQDAIANPAEVVINNDINGFTNAEIFNNKKQYYEQCEELLVMAAYENKNYCLDIKANLNGFVNKQNRIILEVLYDYYCQYALSDETLIMNMLEDNNLKQHLKYLINKSKKSKKETIEKCISDLNKYPYIQKINDQLKEIKTVDDITEIIKNKRDIGIKINSKYKKQKNQTNEDF